MCFSFYFSRINKWLNKQKYWVFDERTITIKNYFGRIKPKVRGVCKDCWKVIDKNSYELDKVYDEIKKRTFEPNSGKGD